jgi:hypothetical protein
MNATPKLERDPSRATAPRPEKVERDLVEALTLGSWAIADRSFQFIGRGAVWLLFRRHSPKDESALYAAAGGALICAVFGGVVGFALSNLSRDISVVEGTILGGLLGVCIGFSFGAFVESIDSTIKDLLGYLNSK